MLSRFYFQFIIGLITIISILYFGENGIRVLALMALLPIVWKIRGYKKPDERELQIFYKISNYTLAGTIGILYLIHHFFDETINQSLIGDMWLSLSIVGIVFIQGMIGLIIFRLES